MLLPKRAEYTKSEGMTFIDPFDDHNVQAGTVAYERNL